MANNVVYLKNLNIAPRKVRVVVDLIRNKPVAQALDIGAPLTFDPARDYVMGHEFACEVLELGPGCDGVPVAPGDLVTSLPISLSASGVEPIGTAR